MAVFSILFLFHQHTHRLALLHDIYPPYSLLVFCHHLLTMCNMTFNAFPLFCFLSARYFLLNKFSHSNAKQPSQTNTVMLINIYKPTRITNHCSKYKLIIIIDSISLFELTDFMNHFQKSQHKYMYIKCLDTYKN